MSSRPLSPLTAFVLFAIISSGAFAQSESVPRARAEDSLTLRNWAVDFSPLTDGPAERSGRVIANAAVPSAASHFITMVPCRVVDTRRPDGLYGGPKLIQSGTRSFDINDGPCSGIPANAAAYSLSISVTQTLGNGSFLTMWPTGGTQPAVASITWNEGLTLTTGAVLPAGTGGSVDVFSSKATHLILDINGYFVEGVVTSLTPGTGTTGGGSGAVTLGIANGGVGAAQLGASAVTTGAIQDGAVTGPKIANAQVVRSVKGLTDGVDIVGAGGNTVTAVGSTITVTAATEVPSGTMIHGDPNDTTLIAAGYTEIVPGLQDYWQATAMSGAPSGRSLATAVWTGTKMIVWGGYGGQILNTGGQYDPAADSWSTTTITGAPTGRYVHAAVWSGSKMIVWGGFDGTYTNSGGQYNPLGDSWAPTNPFGAPLGRAFHTAVWSGTAMIVWGGHEGTNFLNTGAQYDPAGNAWSPTNLTGAPSPRQFHTALWGGGRMIVWGGADGTSSNTGGRYDPAGNTWTPITTTGAPLGRQDHTAVWTGTKMIVWGGRGASYQNTGGQYDPAGDSWSATTTTGAPSARIHFSGVWTGSRLIVWGGDDGFFLNTGGQYDPVANSWSGISATGVPSARSLHSAVWSGRKMIVWGGGNAGAYLNTGGRWGMLSLYRRN